MCQGVPVGAGKISITVAMAIIPSPTGLVGNLNLKVASLSTANFKWSVHGT